MTFCVVCQEGPFIFFSSDLPIKKKMLKFGVFLEWGIILKSFVLVRVQGSFWVVIFFLRPTVIKVAYKGDLNCIAFEKYNIVRCQNFHQSLSKK